MFLKKISVNKDGKHHDYWALVESVRTERGPRHRVVPYLGDMDEAAFRIHKQDLKLRPIWHQREDRVQAHILVCFLTYGLWKVLAQMCKYAGLRNEPRKIVEEIRNLTLVDVVLPTRKGIEIRLRCVSKPEQHLAIL